jgi:transcriptional regulator with XRE-family HTH domain
MTLSDIVVSRARDIVTRRGITIADLARDTGLPESRVRSWFDGRRWGMSLRTVEALADALEVDPWELLRPLKPTVKPRKRCG